jgi:hypothetical protein
MRNQSSIVLDYKGMMKDPRKTFQSAIQPHLQKERIF